VAFAEDKSGPKVGTRDLPPVHPKEVGSTKGRRKILGTRYRLGSFQAFKGPLSLPWDKKPAVDVRHCAAGFFRLALRSARQLSTGRPNCYQWGMAYDEAVTIVRA
jgi:hypothetical protein